MTLLSIHMKVVAQDYSHLIFPNPKEKICIVAADTQQTDMLSGRKMNPCNPLAVKIFEELELPFHQSVIKLNQCSRNLVSDTEGPNVLFLSRTEGGFPRQGLILKEGDKVEELPNLNYVDLVLDEGRLERGALQIFSHELGHVMMNNILTNIPEAHAVKQHVSMGITDYSIAFYEGWGEHFERLTFDLAQPYADHFTRSFEFGRMGSLWHSNIDGELRINGILQNTYIHKKLLPAGVDISQLSHEERILLEHTSPIFDKTRLKNAQQMLSCEGVIATIFYKINSDATLQGHYPENDFFDHFLLSPIPESVKPQDIFTPFENIILKNFWIWKKLNENDLIDKQIFIEFIKAWGDCFPEDKERILKLFLFFTVGKTVSDDLGKIYQEMAYRGMIGNYKLYMELSNTFIQSYLCLTEAVLSGEISINANVGPELWIVNDAVRVRSPLWSEESKHPLTINMNTASVYELASLPKMDLVKANEVIHKRDELGYFKSLDEARLHGLQL